MPGKIDLNQTFMRRTMSTTILKITRKEAEAELKMNLRQQDAIGDKLNWSDLSMDGYIAAEQRLAECQSREKIILETIEFWKQIDKGLDDLIEKKGDDKKVLKNKMMEANKARSELAGEINTKWQPGAVDFTQDSEYKRLYGKK